MKEEYVIDLITRANLGLKLRQRKHHAQYRVAGGPGCRIPPVKAILARKDDEASESRAEEDENPRKKPKGVKYPPIRPNSQLLRVDDFACYPGASIYVDPNNLAYNVMLNKVDLAEGINIFYILQLVQCSSGFVVFCRWGRVGNNSGYAKPLHRGKRRAYSRVTYRDLKDAISAFAEKFRKHTGVSWKHVDKFEQQPGKYNMVELEGRMNPDEIAEEQPHENRNSSELPAPLQDFLKLIFDQEMMRRQMMDANIDLTKMPLGSLSQRQMEQGYHILQEITDILDGTRTVLDDQHRDTLLLDATSRFYIAIPHEFRSWQRPPVIRTCKPRLRFSSFLLACIGFRFFGLVANHLSFQGSIITHLKVVAVCHSNQK
eukprot:m.168153 g.168153  ORF g.168153 m.168153 type:complete len:373 (+) comp16464_c0_seq10:1166-2284(+)